MFVSMVIVSSKNNLRHSNCFNDFMSSTIIQSVFFNGFTFSKLIIKHYICLNDFVISKLILKDFMCFNDFVCSRIIRRHYICLNDFVFFILIWCFICLKVFVSPRIIHSICCKDVVFLKLIPNQYMSFNDFLSSKIIEGFYFNDFVLAKLILENYICVNDFVFFKLILKYCFFSMIFVSSRNNLGILFVSMILCLL